MFSFKKLLFPLLLLLFYTSFAQQIDIGAPLTDSSYKAPLKHFMLIKLDANTETNNIIFKKISNQKDFDIAPNNDINLRLTAHYSFLGLSYSFSPFHANENTKGKSKSSAIALDVVAGKKLGLSFFYGTTRGYYLQNTDDYKLQLTNPALPYALFPDVKTTLFRTENAFYFNGNRFSVRFPVNQYEIQKKSVGSLVLPLNIYYSTINFRNEPFADLTNVGNNVYPEYLSDVFVVTGLGYAYNWVIKPGLILNLSCTPIVGLDINRTDYTNKTSNNSNQFTYGLKASTVLAYVSTTWMGGLSAESANWKSFSTSNDLVGKRNYIKLFIGHNFTPPKALVKAFDWLGNKFKKRQQQ